MFCSDDKHPDSLVAGHINQLVKRALKKGIDLFKVLKAACVNPVQHYDLQTGLLREGDAANFIVVDNLEQWNIVQTFINGELVAEKGQSLIQSVNVQPINNFNCEPITISDVRVKASRSHIHVIEALDGQLITNKIIADAYIQDGYLESNEKEDILKVVVKNRYQQAPVAIAFIKNFGLKKGAIASSIAHDSHNIIALGSGDELITRAVNEIIACQGGIAALSPSEKKILPLPVGGIMTQVDGYEVADFYTEIDQFAKSLGSKLSSPFMTLSFMALLVIPSLKLSDRGLFDGESFEFTNVETTRN
jgi:adenine deaminase